MEAELGKTYEHKLFGVRGIATAKVEYLTGCTSIRLQYRIGGDLKELWVDEPMLNLVEEDKQVAKTGQGRGGDRSTPPPRHP